MDRHATPPPPSLQDLQQLFGRALLPGTAASEVDAIYDGMGGDSRVHPEARFAVYRHNAISGQIRALKSIYPACLRILGEPCLRTLGRDYLAAHPSTDPDLNRFGDRFPDLLQQLLQTRTDFADYPYLPDLAQLEWAWHQAYYAANTVAFDGSCLQDADVDQQALVFELQPGLTTVSSRWPLLALWKPGAWPDDEAGARPVCVHRHGLEPRVEVIDADLFALLQGIRDRLPLGALANAGLAVGRIAELLQRGWLASARPETLTRDLT
jgi:hypothetical protein